MNMVKILRIKNSIDCINSFVIGFKTMDRFVIIKIILFLLSTIIFPIDLEYIVIG